MVYNAGNQLLGISMNAHYFTTKVATEASFCNREQETTALISSIKKNQHTVVVAPRRYGKTSLVMHALNQSQLPCACIDLFCVVYEEDICRKVAKAISSLIRQVSTFSEKTLHMLEQCFKTVLVAFSSGHIELKMEFGKNSAGPIAQLEDLLEGLEKLAQKHKQPVILFFDEFQDVLKMDETNKIQAAIRAVAQHSKYVNYIFSGSSRIMLNKIFDDKKQPLYMLCNKMLLDRISFMHFDKHLQSSAKRHWKQVLSKEVMDKIALHTESHPYYVNLLCNKLWEREKIPTTKDVDNIWDAALAENKGKIIADLSSLNTNRLKVLTTVALLDTVNEPNSKLFLDEVKLPLSSTQNAVHYLLNHDYLHETKTGLQLIDPLMKKFLVERYHNQY